MIPALLLILSRGRLPDRHRAFRAVRFDRLAELRAARCDRALRAAYFPAKYKFTVPMLALLISDMVLNAHYGFSLFSPFVAFALHRLRRSSGVLGLLLQNRASLQDAAAGFARRFAHLLRRHEFRLLALSIRATRRTSPAWSRP